VIFGFEEVVDGMGLDVFGLGIEVGGGLLLGVSVLRMALMVVEPKVKMAVGF